MSVAFVREESAETAAEVDLPDRPISPHPNLVTELGLQALKKAMADARAAYDAAQKIDDVNERRRSAAPAIRDMRYFAERLRSAKLMPPAVSAKTVAFGNSVTFMRDDGRRQAGAGIQAGTEVANGQFFSLERIHKLCDWHLLFLMF